MNNMPKNDVERVPWLTVERPNSNWARRLATPFPILVLEIKVPEAHDFGAEGVVSLMQKVSRDIMVYLLSFSLIGVFWLQHHVMFHYVARTDRAFVFFNVIFLFLLSLSPFTTELAGEYRGIRPAEALFGVNLLLSGVMLLVMWRYLVRNEYLLRKPVSVAVVRSMSRRILIAPLVILLGIAVSAFNFHLGALVYFSMPLFYLKHWLADTSWQDQE